MHQLALPPNELKSQDTWVEETLQSLTLRQRIGQLFHIQLKRTSHPDKKRRIVDQLANSAIGGVFTGCWTQSYQECRDTLCEIEAASPVPMLVSGDHECGCRIKEGTPFGSAMSLAAIEDLKDAETYAYEVGKHTAKQGRVFGACWSFAPVVDINLHHENPITNTRSYGSDPERVAVIASAYVRGMQDYGMAATLKHFPGDGVDSRDQHVTTTVNSLAESRWFEMYGKTFQAGIQAGAYSVMIGHIGLGWCSSRDQQTGFILPATVDRRIQVDLLRHKFQFDGVVITDAIGMTGLTSHFKDEPSLVVAALAAGADVVLFVNEITKSIDAVEKALDHGTIPEVCFNESVRRVLRLKKQLQLDDSKTRYLDDVTAAENFEDREAITLSRSLADKSVTLVRDVEGAYRKRLKEGSKILLFELPLEYDFRPKLLVGEEDVGDQRMTMQIELEKRGYQTAFANNKQTAQKAIDEGVDAIIYLFLSTPQAGRGNIRLSRAALDGLNWQVIQSPTPTFFVSMGNPYIAWELPTVRNFVCLYSKQSNVQAAYVRMLLGEIPFQGKLPVELPED